MKTIVAALLLFPFSLSLRGAPEKAQDLGSRLELMVDEQRIDHLSGGAALRLHRPTPREVVIVRDKPWEGNASLQDTVFQDGDLYRMYYGGRQFELSGNKLKNPHKPFLCYAESKDGIRWTRPALGLVEFNGSRENNILWDGIGADNFAPFKDGNPLCRADARYKALGGSKKDGGLFAFKSPDGIHWSLMSDKPVITQGAFDSHNLAFWDGVRRNYRDYHRGFRDGLRDILTATSDDFLRWSDPVWLAYPGAPGEQLYENKILPYYRAPDLFVGFPTRYVERGWSQPMRALPELDHREARARVSQRYGTALTDSLFMTSRDGMSFKRWGEAFIRPGLRPTGNWTYGDNYQAWGLVETRSDIPDAPNELSLYASEGYWRGNSTQLRRFTLRIDGFVSVQAPLGGGEFLTKPITFQGNQLVLNYSTSAAGSVQIEVQDVEGKPVEGYARSDCPEIFGDSLEQVVHWKGGSEVGRLAGKPVRLRFVLKDADLFSFRFR